MMVAVAVEVTVEGRGRGKGRGRGRAVRGGESVSEKLLLTKRGAAKGQSVVSRENAAAAGAGFWAERETKSDRLGQLLLFLAKVSALAKATAFGRLPN